MKWRTAAVLLCAAVLSGCSLDWSRPDRVGTMTTIPERVLASDWLGQAVVVAKTYSRVLEAAALLLASLVLGWRAFHGQGWKEEASRLTVYLLLWGFLVETSGTSASPAYWLFRAGQFLAAGGRLGVPDGVLMQVWEGILRRWSLRADEIVSLTWPNPNDAARIAESLAHLLSTPAVVAALSMNALGVWTIKSIAHVVYGFLVGFYWVVIPLMSWTLFLPQTRRVFWGVTYSYASVALWPLFFAIADRIWVALQLETWFGKDVVAEEVLMSQYLFFLMNVVSIFVYIGIPIVSYKIVTGVATSFGRKG